MSPEMPLGLAIQKWLANVAANTGHHFDGPPTLINLPNELKEMIINNLRYPDLLRLRGTCRSIRSSITTPQIVNAWRALKDHLIEFSGSGRLNVSNRQRFPFGYVRSDLRRLTACCMCPGCRAVVRKDDICKTYVSTPPPLGDLVGTLYSRPLPPPFDIWPNIWAGDSPELLSGVNPYGKWEVCSNCFIECEKFHALFARWSHSQRHWVVKCVDCNKGHRYRLDYMEGLNEPTREQLYSGRCLDCLSKAKLGHDFEVSYPNPEDFKTSYKSV
jgi:hypothetical protein